MPIELHGTYYTATEAAEELGYRDGSYVSRLCSQGATPASRVGTVWLIPATWVLEQKKISPKGQGSRGVSRK